MLIQMRFICYQTHFDTDPNDWLNKELMSLDEKMIQKLDSKSWIWFHSVTIKATVEACLILQELKKMKSMIWNFRNWVLQKSYQES